MSPCVFTNLLSQAAFRHDLDRLNAQSKSFLFEGLKSNNMQDIPADATDHLLDLQYDVDSLRDWLRHASKFVPPRIVASTVLYRRRGLSREHDDCIEQTDQLEESGMNASRLFMSSLSAVEAQHRTYLAEIYLPWSVATGIFRMNVNEIDDSGLPVWAFVVTLAILALYSSSKFARYSSTKKINPRWSREKLMLSIKQLRPQPGAETSDLEK